MAVTGVTVVTRVLEFLTVVLLSPWVLCVLLVAFVLSVLTGVGIEGAGDDDGDDGDDLWGQ